MTNSLSMLLNYRILTTKMFSHMHTPPPVPVQIEASRDNPVLGMMYTLTRTVTADDVTTYQWKKNGLILQGKTTKTLSFSPLRLSNAGRYTCGITVMDSPILSSGTDIVLQSKHNHVI